MPSGGRGVHSQDFFLRVCEGLHGATRAGNFLTRDFLFRLSKVNSSRASTQAEQEMIAGISRIFVIYKHFYS